MAPQPIDSRVDSLEDRVTQLEQQLGPDGRDPSQIVPLRTELRAEFSAVRGHLAALDAKFEGLDAKFEGLDARFESIDARFESIDARFVSIDARFVSIDAKFERIDAKFVSLESKIDQQGILMRVLHEEVISRIALISEGAPATARRPRKK